MSAFSSASAFVSCFDGASREVPGTTENIRAAQAASPESSAGRTRGTRDMGSTSVRSGLFDESAVGQAGRLPHERSLGFLALFQALLETPGAVLELPHLVLQPRQGRLVGIDNRLHGLHLGVGAAGV